MTYHVAQIRKPIDSEMKATESCFIIIAGPVHTVLEARDIVENFVDKGADESWFIIIQTYPTTNQKYE